MIELPPKISRFHHSDFLFDALTDISNGLSPESSSQSVPTNVSNDLNLASSSQSVQTNVSNDLNPESSSVNALTDVSNSLDFVSFPPVSAVHSAGDVLSLEAMLFKRKLEYDFDVTLGKVVAGI